MNAISKTYMSKPKKGEPYSYTLSKHSEDTVMLIDSLSSASTMIDFIITAKIKIQYIKRTNKYFVFRVKILCYGRTGTVPYEDIYVHTAYEQDIKSLIKLCE